MTATTLRAFTRADLATVESWFRDAQTQRWLGGPQWPAAMLDLGEQGVGSEFRGAVQTGAHRYLASIHGEAFGYVDCGTFDRHVIYGGEGPDGPIVTQTDGVVTGAIAFTVAPEHRRRGLGRAMIAALMQRPELQVVELFEAGIEPDNTPSRRCLEAASFTLRSPDPDYEGMLYYLAQGAGRA